MGALFVSSISGRPRCVALRAFVVLGLIAATIAATDPPVSPQQVPAGTRVRFHLTAPLSSNESKTGQPFAFVLIDPIVVGGQVVAAAGATGAGTLLLAGPAGSKGHEGDLTLRIDTVPTTDGGRIVFDHQRFEINGANEKVASAVAGFVPIVGFFAQFMRGQDERVGVNTAIDTALLSPAAIVAPAPVCAASSPTSFPSPATSTSPPPVASSAPSASPSLAPTPCSPPPPCSQASPSDTPSALPVPSASALAPTATPSPCATLPACAPVIPSDSPSASASPSATASASPAASPSGLPSPSPTTTPCAPPTPTAWVTPYRFASPPLRRRDRRE